jgi:hypothetical protein
LNVFGHDTNAIARDLQKPTSHQKLRDTTSAPHLERAAAEQRHERRVAGKDTHFSVKRRRYNSVGVAVEHSCLR